MNNKRWNIEVHASDKTVWHYENVKDVVVEKNRVSFETSDGRIILTTLPYMVQEIK
jgi:hypothetical protein